MKKLITLSIIAFSSLAIQAQSFITDGVFGDNGHIFAPPGAAGGVNSNILIQQDGKILLCGFVYDGGCNCNYNTMFRTDECGNVDSSFGVNGLVRHTFDQRNLGAYYVLQPDGKILVAGVQSDGNAGSQQFPYIGRYNSNGSVDSSFATNGTNKINNLGPGIFSFIYLTPDNKILVSGSPNGNNFMVMRFDTAGVVDATFGSGGVVQHAVPSGINFFYDFATVMRSDSKIVSAAPAWLGGAASIVTLVCYDTLGAVDTTFGINGYYIDNNFSVGGGGTPRIILQSDDKVVLAKQNENETDIRVARYTTNGVLDSTFGVNGYVLLSGLSAPARLEYISKFPDDSFIIGFAENGVPSHFIKYSADGIVDPTFSLDGSAYFQFPVSLEKAQIGFASTNDGFIMGAPMALKKYGLTSAAPDITQNNDTLFANVNDATATLQWSLDGTVIGGATDTFLVTTQNGSYSIEVVNSLGCTATDTFQVTNTGIIVQTIEGLVSFYPNPVTDFMSFENRVGKEIAITIYDISGKLMMKSKMNSGTGKIDLSVLPAGVYMVEVKTDSAVSKKRIIKQ